MVAAVSALEIPDVLEWSISIVEIRSVIVGGGFIFLHESVLKTGAVKGLNGIRPLGRRDPA